MGQKAKRKKDRSSVKGYAIKHEKSTGKPKIKQKRKRKK